jgi:hypothetical protein
VSSVPVRGSYSSAGERPRSLDRSMVLYDSNV